MSAQISAAGNWMDTVTFDVDGKEVRAFLLHKGSQSVKRHEMVRALGLPQQFRYSQAIGRKCHLTLGVDGMFNTIERARTL